MNPELSLTTGTGLFPQMGQGVWDLKIEIMEQFGIHPWDQWGLPSGRGEKT